MDSAAAGFGDRVKAVLVRFYGQNAQSVPPAAELDAFAARLEQVIAERGLPSPLAAGERGAPGGLAEAELDGIVARLLPEGGDDFLRDVARQLAKTCFYPEFTTCRGSYGERSRDGACRRQEESRARRRLSGSHCVDCPYWVALGAAQHEAFLAKAWHSGPVDFKTNQAIFLPEDFRALRGWRWNQARVGPCRDGQEVR